MKTIADAITSAIAADAGLNAEDYEVSFNASKQTVSITNLSSENVTMVSDLRTGDGTSVTDSGGLTVATIDPADAVTVLNDLSTDPLSVGNFSFTMGGETVDLTDALSGFSGDVGELATKLNTAITQQSEFAGIQGIGDDLFSADGSNNLVFINKTLETANFSLSVTDDAGVTQTATNQTAAAGTIITTTDRVDTAGTFDISLGSTGTINITGVGEFEFSVERGSTLTTLANAIEDTIRTQAGNEDIAVTVDGTELVFTNSGFTDFVFDLNLEDGRNAALFDDTLQGAVVQDLNQYFASGQTGLFEITIEGPRNEDPVVISIPDARSLDDVVGRINRETADTGVRANVSYDGTDINFTSTLGGDFTVKIESDLGLEDEPLERTVEATTKDNSQLVDNFSVLSIDSSNDTLLAVDFALQQINGLRAQLGAVQNRLESTISNLTVGSENLSASRSRIMDADFAAETAALTRGQILQQAGTSVLAQANQLPQSVLQLLQG
ncbi:flagellin [Ectothiorhodospira haloalkaliphila]|uniref:flagellin n=2 Tax=Ectothiorhodospira haloalkaliphila TaxID=421628 RepID=UPI003AF67B84